MEIIPSVIGKTVAECLTQIKQLGESTKLIHLDVVDNSLFKGESTTDLTALILPPHQFDLHLMVNDALAYLSKVDFSCLRYVFVHPTASKCEETLDILQRGGVKVGLALGPDESVDLIEPFQTSISAVLILTVDPGAAGRPFHPRLLTKATQVKELYPNLNVYVDGGIDEKTIAEVKSADGVIVHSAIFNQPDPANALQKLQSRFN